MLRAYAADADTNAGCRHCRVFMHFDADAALLRAFTVRYATLMFIRCL